ncbi:MAG: hypothetical protein SVV03_05295 [Candidatus Nanohaloarchaea archaeon]|nr:hypothetical protein [Candidatus Nanohaloarchaea archaeon]
MVGTSFFKAGHGKCPNCGYFGDQAEEEVEDDRKVCPKCETVFNKYMILEPGSDVNFKNN